MADQIEVYLDRSGKWHWRHEGKKVGGTFPTRAEAFEAALIEREGEAIVLLRKDGSVHGELYHGRSEGGPPQRVDILAATEKGEAVNGG